MRVTLGAPGRIIPPAAKAVEFAQRAERDGFDAIWWPCHLMGWIPDSVWTEDMTELARYQASPHTHLDPLMMMGAAGAATSSIKVGVCVTDTIRRHPAMLAQAALTADHLSQGRAILGLGSGETMNITPYGMDFTKPVGRLEEAVKVMRLLWSTDKPVDFDGQFFQLRDAVLGLEPYEGRPPQVWLAAHGPRMLRITGRLADGWLPTNIRPDAYAEKLAAIR
jgi:phthiodiolone/phenolphthiodiolone dimycocerosates ketoreductase